DLSRRCRETVARDPTCLHDPGVARACPLSVAEISFGIEDPRPDLLRLRIPTDPLRPAPFGLAFGLDRVFAHQELLILLPAHCGRDFAFFTLVDPVADEPFEVSQRSSLVRGLTRRGCFIVKLGQPPLVSLANDDEAVTSRGERSAIVVLELETAHDGGDVRGEEVDRADLSRDLARRSIAERFGVMSTDQVTPPNLVPVLVDEYGVVGESSREFLGISLVVGLGHGFE